MVLGSKAQQDQLHWFFLNQGTVETKEWLFSFLTQWMPFFCHITMQQHFIIHCNCNLKQSPEVCFSHTQKNEQNCWTVRQEEKIESCDQAWDWHPEAYPGPPFSVRELCFLPLLQAQLEEKTLLVFSEWNEPWRALCTIWSHAGMQVAQWDFVA